MRCESKAEALAEVVTEQQGLDKDSYSENKPDCKDKLPSVLLHGDLPEPLLAGRRASTLSRNLGSASFTVSSKGQVKPPTTQVDRNIPTGLSIEPSGWNSYDRTLGVLFLDPRAVGEVEIEAIEGQSI